MLPNESEVNPYLQQEIISASPARLRWMLIQRAEDLCGLVQQLWIAGERLQAAGWLLRIREILGELLDGVADKNNPVSHQVSDFYIFLIQLLTRLEQTNDPEQLKTLQELLHLENETWQQVVQKLTIEASAGSSTNTMLIPPTIDHNSPGEYSGGFNLEI